MGKELTLSVDVERDDVERSVTVHVGTGPDTSGPTFYAYLNDEGTIIAWDVAWHDAEDGTDVEQGSDIGEVTQVVAA